MVPYVMPIKILIEKSNIMAENVRYYTRDGQPLYSMTYIPSIVEATTEKMDDELFCELMSIHTVADARSVTEKYPYLRFSYRFPPAFDVEEMDTEERYCKAMVDAVILFNSVKTFLALQRTYFQHRDENEMNLDSSERKMLREIYSRHFHQLNVKKPWRRLSEMESAYYDYYYENNDMDQYVEQYNSYYKNNGIKQFAEQNANIELSDIDPMFEYFEYIPEACEAYHEAVEYIVHDYVNSDMFNDVSAFVSKIISRASITFDTKSSSLVYKCPDLLTAMYMMVFVSMFNEDEYRQCTKCHAYFKLNKSHPQTMCDTHMAPRRLKRKNARDKGKTDYSKRANPSDFEE